MNVALQSDVYACIADDKIVLLDLLHDRYHGVSGLAEAAVRRMIAGFSLNEIEQLSLSPLVAANLITYTDAPVTSAIYAERCGAAHSLFDEQQKRRYLFTPIFAAWYHKEAEIAVSRHGLKHVLDRLKLTKSRANERGIRSNRERTLSLAAAFSRYARIMKTHDRCLHRSIALAKFLNHHGQFPELVVAVKTKPFAAHAWVQFEKTVLNDELDYVLPFTPIFTV